MGMASKPLSEHFAPHQVPALLTELHAFASKVRGKFFSGHLELSDFDGKGSAHELAAHVVGGLAAVGSEITSKLVLFAQEGDGSLYGLWLDGTKSLDRAPVVFICSEGDADAVVAADLREFLAFLRLDIDEVGRSYAVSRDGDAAHAPAHLAYVDWADAQGIPAAPKSLKLAVKAAQKKHPTFKRWLSSVRKKLHGAPARTAKPAAPAADEIPDCGVVSLEIRTDTSQLEAAMPKLLAALNRHGCKATSKARLGLTETEPCSFHETGRFPPNIALASELRSEWVLSQEPKIKRVLIFSPPAKSRKHWEVELWVWPYPGVDQAALADLKVIDACLQSAGKLLKRRGNAAHL
jgi:hypothetical protein